MKPWKSAPLPDGSYADDTKPFSDQDVVNLIPTFAETRGARSAVQLRPLPGLQEFASVGTGPHRGAHNAEGRWFQVSGTSVYQVFPDDGTATLIGTVPGTGRVSISHNQITNGNQVKFVNGSAGYIYDTTDASFTRITDDAYPGEIVTDYIASLFVGIEPQRRYALNSALADGLSYNSEETFEGEASPDRMVSLKVIHSELLLLNETTCEMFDYTGTVNALFENKRITIERGCAATYGVAALDNTAIWPDNTGDIVRLNGYTPVPISTQAIAQDLARCDLSKAFAFTWEDKGYKVYYLTCPDGHTWGWDAKFGKWHRRESYGLTRWRVNTLVKVGNYYYAGDFRDGRIYRLNWDYPLEGCDDYERYFYTPVLHDNGNRVTLDGFRLDIDSGGVSVDCAGVFDLSLAGSLASGDVGTVVDFTYDAIGGTSPKTFELLSGSLPPGVDMDTTGNITGTYSTSGFYSWSVRVTDNEGNTADLADTAGVIELSGSPSVGAVGVAYSYALTGAGGVAPRTFALTTGVLPDGLSLSSAGVISGTPTTLETKAFTVTLTDAEGTTTTHAFSITIAVFTVVGDLPSGVVGDVVSYQYTQVGGTEPVVYSITAGALPTGLSMDAAGLVTGTLSASGSFSWTVHGVDNAALTDDQTDTAAVTTLVLLAVGDTGTISTAPDAATWTARTSGVTNNLKACAVGSASYVAVGDKASTGLILYSADQATWVSKTTNIAVAYIRGVASDGGSIFVAGGHSGGTADGKITRSTDGGLTWAAVTAPTGCGPINAMCRGNGLFVGVTGTGKAIVSTNDGVSWVKYNCGTNLLAVTYNDVSGLFMAVGSNGQTYISTAGASWTHQSSQFGASASFAGVSFIGARFFAAAYGDTTYPGIYVSDDDGVTWTKKQGTGAGSCAGVANSIPLVSETNNVWTSSDSGNTWTSATAIVGHTINGVAGGLVT